MFGFKSAVNRFMTAQNETNRNRQRAIDALIETNALMMQSINELRERIARLERVAR